MKLDIWSVNSPDLKYFIFYINVLYSR